MIGLTRILSVNDMGLSNSFQLVDFSVSTKCVNATVSEVRAPSDRQFARKAAFLTAFGALEGALGSVCQLGMCFD